ncbi:hypothetical protein H8356DRAFT_955936 [Neocallimastix lanati (nom. inval.)]|uniref:Uncharacterized protein n=1 Tax=Neocallimastix californiae TaxID=1754190 RepID=A0A1Y2EWI8_9FUNG|nr:hypothetical protein H8356DRAFT_955936 [Neocallimastix sp. JGI-2020a]ORY75920.1 hypothetical protein LY90DRAFT_502035 [Neocallimastix californiae]|eukprot:ORY75920.1 hypothetical protein LY90DRAFT_502035 [Neocallimastix californiae]
MSFRRRIYYNRKFADQQRDSTNVIINCNKSFSCGQTYNEVTLDVSDNNEGIYENKFIDSGTLAVNIYDVLLNTEYYQNYSEIYDQFKINAIKVKITPVVWATSRDSNPEKGYSLPRSLMVITTLDRSGLDESQFIKDMRGDRYCIIAGSIENYSSAITKHLGPGSSEGITRMLYPSTSQEKSQYVSTRDLKGQYERLNREPYYYDLGDAIENKDLPNNILCSPSLAFKPTLLLAVRSPNPVSTQSFFTYERGELVHKVIGTNKLYPTTFDIEFSIDITFRGLRYNKYI